MTTWIGTNQAGWDTQAIGFHSVNGCTGLVVSTPQWVAGWHIGGGAGGTYGVSNMTKAGFGAPAVLQYLQSIVPHPWPANGKPAGKVQLLAVYQDLADWKTVLREFAQVIGYTGKARGFGVRSKVGQDPCDFLIEHINGDCTVRYKRTSKMTHVKQTDHELQTTRVKTIGAKPQGFEVMPLLNKESASASVVATPSNRASMHQVSSFSYDSITI